MLATAVQVNMDEIGNRILSVFSVSVNYGVVKIAHFNFYVVLQTNRAHYDLSWFIPLL
jgi:hypothetical protein